jgi:ribosomal protein L11 methyltransferase
MYSIRIPCSREDVDRLSGELWERGTIGIREVSDGDGDGVALIATFENPQPGSWKEDEGIDWVAETQRTWKGRTVGKRIFLAPVWSDESTPQNRVRLIHNPSLASGTGEHPCTQLALMALEEAVSPGCRVVDVGTGSGILAIAALLLGAASAIGLDPDETALGIARENHRLNGLVDNLAAGSAECLPDGCANITVANISATVLLSLGDDLLRITATGGRLILTGFTEPELTAIEQNFPAAESRVFQSGEWSCVSLRLS